MANVPTSQRSQWMPAAAILIAVAALALTLFNCSQGPRPASSKGTLESIRETRKLRAAYVPYPPFVQRDLNTGQLSGYFIEIMERIADEGGFSVEYEEATWATMVAGLEAHKYSLVVSAIFRTVPRAMEVVFTDPVLYIGTGGVVRAGDDRVRSAEDLSKPGLRIAVLNGAVSHEYVKRSLPDAKVTVVSGTDIARPMQEVLSGRADIALAESLACGRFVREHPELKDVFADHPFSLFGASLMARYEDRDWVEFLNIALDRLALDGRLEEVDRKYRRQLPAGGWRLRRKPWDEERGRP